MTHIEAYTGGKAVRVSPDFGFNRQTLQSSYYSYVQIVLEMLTMNKKRESPNREIVCKKRTTWKF